jgi:hypothetical protein
MESHLEQRYAVRDLELTLQTKDLAGSIEEDTAGSGLLRGGPQHTSNQGVAELPQPFF